MMEQTFDIFLKNEKQKKYFEHILFNLKNDVQQGLTICPHKNDILRAFKLCPLNNLKIVIFGQDPYYTKNTADGLAFSTRDLRTPPSLQNIFKELKNEYPEIAIEKNDLSFWAEQGILLLNTYLTTIEGSPKYHSAIGWETFIINTINFLNHSKDKIIYVLWGNDAQKLEQYIDISKNYILKSAHPSPFSCYRGFFGNNHFKKINQILKENSQEEINWNLLK